MVAGGGSWLCERRDGGLAGVGFRVDSAWRGGGDFCLPVRLTVGISFLRAKGHQALGREVFMSLSNRYTTCTFDRQFI